MKRLRLIILISAVFILASLGVVLFLMMGRSGPIAADGTNIKEIFASGEDWVPYVMVPLAIIITLGSMIPFFRIMFPARIRNGEAARATILRVWDTGTTINDNPQIGLELEVVTKEGRRFTGQAKTLVSRLNAALVQPGLSAQVIYDPQNPRRIQVVKVETPDASGAATDDPESRLARLAALRDRGLISEEEYQRKREEIIRLL